MNDLPTFDPERGAFIEEAVKSGRYALRAEVIEEALLLPKRRDASLAKLDADLARGIADGRGNHRSPARHPWHARLSKIVHARL